MSTNIVEILDWKNNLQVMPRELQKIVSGLKKKTIAHLVRADKLG
jgi:hypothetical protein